MISKCSYGSSTLESLPSLLPSIYLCHGVCGHRLSYVAMISAPLIKIAGAIKSLRLTAVSLPIHDVENGEGAMLASTLIVGKHKNFDPPLAPFNLRYEIFKNLVICYAHGHAIIRCKRAYVLKEVHVKNVQCSRSSSPSYLLVFTKLFYEY